MDDLPFAFLFPFPLGVSIPRDAALDECEEERLPMLDPEEEPPSDAEEEPH
jgi:hypothetical protein